jgi:hypothetical protein
MTVEPWQIKKYYRPRVLIGTADLLDPPLPDMTLVCLTGSELLLLRNVLDYCHRRSTFVVTYGTDTYVTPDNETWDVVQAIVAELEGKLMADCSDLLEKLDLVIAALDLVGPGLTSINETLALMDAGISSIVDRMDIGNEYLQCVCSKLDDIRQDPATAAIVDAGITDGSLIVDDPYPQEETPGIDSDACAVAQLTWAFMYEMMTEVIAPAQDKAHSILFPLALTVIASWIGTPLLGIPVGAVMMLVYVLMDAWVEGRFTTIENAIFTNKDELICAAYEELRKTGNLQAAATAVADAIREIPELSVLDVVCMSSLTSSWVMSRMGVAWQNMTPWALQRVTPGYCSTCGTIEGDDWYAVAVPEPEGDLEFDHTAGAYWLKHTYCAPNESEVLAYVAELVAVDGNCSIGWNNESAVDCTGSTISPTNSMNDPAGTEYYVYRQFTHNDAQAVSMLCPGATLQNTNMNLKYADDPFAIQAMMGWNCTGTATVRIKYIVYPKA